MNADRNKLVSTIQTHLKGASINLLGIEFSSRDRNWGVAHILRAPNITIGNHHHTIKKSNQGIRGRWLC